MKLAVDENKCTGCKKCIQGCSFDAISMKNDIAVINYEICSACGACINYCPHGVLIFQEELSR